MKDTLFHQRLREKGFLILTHRGMRGGNIPENTIKSTQLAYQLGSDLVEVDIARSKDGVYYLFHHNNEKRLLGVENGSLEKLTSAEIDALAYLNGIGDDSGYHLEKLSDFLAWLPVDGLVNIDRSWFYWDDPAFMRLFVDTQTLDRVFFKSPLEDELLAKLNSIDSMCFTCRFYASKWTCPILMFILMFTVLERSYCRQRKIHLCLLLIGDLRSVKLDT